MAKCACPGRAGGLLPKWRINLVIRIEMHRYRGNLLAAFYRRRHRRMAFKGKRIVAVALLARNRQILTVKCVLCMKSRGPSPGAGGMRAAQAGSGNRRGRVAAAGAGGQYRCEIMKSNGPLL